MSVARKRTSATSLPGTDRLIATVAAMSESKFTGLGKGLGDLAGDKARRGSSSHRVRRVNDPVGKGADEVEAHGTL